jgi:hypothetical protein
MPVASALTKCQEEVSHIPAVHPGTFRPKCDENGNYMPLQCHGSIGYCWCVFPNGTEVPHTRSRGRHNCSGKQGPPCQQLEGPERTRKAEGQEIPPGIQGPGHWGWLSVMHPSSPLPIPPLIWAFHSCLFL